MAARARASTSFGVATAGALRLHAASHAPPGAWGGQGLDLRVPHRGRDVGHRLPRVVRVDICVEIEHERHHAHQRRDAFGRHQVLRHVAEGGRLDGGARTDALQEQRESANSAMRASVCHG